MEVARWLEPRSISPTLGRIVRAWALHGRLEALNADVRL